MAVRLPAEIPLPGGEVLAVRAAKPRTKGRTALALVAPAVAAVCSANLAASLPVPQLWAALLPAVAGGLTAWSSASAAACAAVGVCLGYAFAYAGFAAAGGFAWPSTLQHVLPAAALAAGGAAVLNAAVGRRPEPASSRVVAAALLGIVGLMWFSGYARARVEAVLPLADEEQVLRSGMRGAADYHLFLQTHVLMEQGRGYYSAMKEAGHQLDMAERPHAAHLGQNLRVSPFAYREPLLFYLWKAVARRPGEGLVALYLCFATAAVLSAYVFAATHVRRALALCGAAAVATFYAATTGVALPQAEPWAAAAVVGSLAALALEARRPPGSSVVPYTLAAAGLALTAALIRELDAVVLLGGLVWALAARDRRRQAVWGAACLAFVFAYLLHVRATGAPLSALHAGSYPMLVPARPFHVLTYGTEGLLGYPWAWLVLALLGVRGALRTGSRRERLWMSFAVVVPALMAVVTGPMAHNDYGPALARMWTPLSFVLTPDGVASCSSYWGGLALPALLAAFPLAFAALPVARRPGVRVEADAEEGLAAPAA